MEQFTPERYLIKSLSMCWCVLQMDDVMPVSFLQPNPMKLESVVNEAKKLHIEAKLKAKGLSSEAGTPVSGSRPGSLCRP